MDMYSNDKLCDENQTRTDTKLDAERNSDVLHDDVTEDSDDVAPDGGYGWIIVAASLIATTVVGGSVAAFSILYVEWTEYFRADKGVTGWIGSLNIASGNLLGVVFSIFVNKYGCRVVCVFGAGTACLGLCLSSTVNTLSYLFLTYGLITGTGSGVIFLCATVVVQQYFNKRRPLAAGIVFSGLAIGSLMSPPLVQFSIYYYGWRGTMLLMAGVFLQCAVCGVLFRPLPKKSSPKSITKNTSVIYVPKSKIETNGSMIAEEKAKLSKRFNVKDVFDYSLLKNINFSLFCLGTILLNFGVMTFMQHAPGRAFTYGVDRSKITILPTCLGLTSAVFTVLFGYLANLNLISRATQYAVSVTLGGILVVAYALATTFPAFIVFGLVMGIVHGATFTVQPSLIVDMIGVKNAARGTAFFTMSLGFGFLLSVPFAGFLYDVSGNYEVPFIVNGCIQILAGFCLMYMPYCEWRDKRRQSKTKR